MNRSKETKRSRSQKSVAQPEISSPSSSPLSAGAPVPEFNRFNAQLLGVSVDNIWSHLAFSRDRKLGFPLLSDFHPKGAVAREYGVYRQEDGMTERALFVIDGKGIIRWSYVSPMGVNPGANGILGALESLGVK